MIRFDNVSKRFGRREVLRGVALETRPGLVTALVGPNGSGKTTLIKCILGLTIPDSGRVTVGGAVAGRDGAYRRQIGYMPQIARLPEHLRVCDLLDTVATVRGDAKTDDALIDAFHLAREMEKPLGTLSGGTRQKVNAAIAFRYRPRLIVLDEPTAGLDPIAARVLKDAIRRARSNGCTVFITSHILSELEELADDVAFLNEGELKFAGSISALLAATGESRLEGAVATMMDPGTSIGVSRATSSGAKLSLIRTRVAT
jgi:Cu-processing system ATP-binding protein